MFHKIEFPIQGSTVSGKPVVLVGFLPKTELVVGEVFSLRDGKWKARTWDPMGAGPYESDRLDPPSFGLEDTEKAALKREKFKDYEKHHKFLNDGSKNPDFDADAADALKAAMKAEAKTVKIING